MKRPRMPREVVATQAETARYFAARAARATPEQAAAILARAGVGQAPEPGDELPAELAARLGRSD